MSKSSFNVLRKVLTSYFLLLKTLVPECVGITDHFPPAEREERGRWGRSLYPSREGGGGEVGEII